MKLSAACHIHSEWSYDAKWPLRDIASEFAKRGYRILLITEHDRGFSEERFQQHREACAEVSSKDLLVVPGIEYSDSQNLVHILTWGIYKFLGEGLPTLQLLKMVGVEDGVAVMAHPARRQAWKVFEPSWSNYLLGIEAWNRKADGWAPSVPGATLLSGTDLVPFASLDFHSANQLFPLSMELDIRGSVTEESVVDCLRARNCRAMAFSKPIQMFSEGWGNFALGHAEKVRRSAASVYRGIKRVMAS